MPATLVTWYMGRGMRPAVRASWGIIFAGAKGFHRALSKVVEGSDSAGEAEGGALGVGRARGDVVDSDQLGEKSASSAPSLVSRGRLACLDVLSCWPCCLSAHVVLL